MPECSEVLTFWFGSFDQRSEPHAQRPEFQAWWQQDPDFDAAIRARFAGLWRRAMAGELADWEADPRGSLGLVVLLDQMSRNMWRGSGQMFAGDERARAVVWRGLGHGFDEQLSCIERYVFYMPLMHSEDLADHDEARVRFTRLRDESDAPEFYGKGLEFEDRHRAIIERFGRYPHRNALLGRESTEAERQFLQQPGSSF